MADAGLFGFRAMVRAAIPPEARGTMVFGARDEPRVVGILRTSGRSGKGRWVGRLVVLALLLVAFVLLLLFLGRPTEPKMFAEDVTDRIAAGETGRTSGGARRWPYGE